MNCSCDWVLETDSGGQFKKRSIYSSYSHHGLVCSRMVVTFQFLVCPYYSSSASASRPSKHQCCLVTLDRVFSCYNSRRSNEKNQRKEPKTLMGLLKGDDLPSSLQATWGSFGKCPVCFLFFFVVLKVLGDKIPPILVNRHSEKSSTPNFGEKFTKKNSPAEFPKLQRDQVMIALQFGDCLEN